MQPHANLRAIARAHVEWAKVAMIIKMISFQSRPIPLAAALMQRNSGLPEFRTIKMAQVA
jgi:hypothetical protein